MIRKGENHPLAKLTAKDVREIRRTYAETNSITLKDLSEKYDITKSQIWRIVNGFSWQEVD